MGSDSSPGVDQSQKTLFEQLGGYDGVSKFVDHLFQRVEDDPVVGRFWAYRGNDGLEREKQHAIDFLCSSSGGPMYYRGRDMKLAHQGMGITEEDWGIFIHHTEQSMMSLGVPDDLQSSVLQFMETLKTDIMDM